jgi:hypothetical protein
VKGNHVKSRLSKHVLPCSLRLEANAHTSRIEEPLRQTHKPRPPDRGNGVDKMGWKITAQVTIEHIFRNNQHAVWLQ